MLLEIQNLGSLTEKPPLVLPRKFNLIYDEQLSQYPLQYILLSQIITVSLLLSRRNSINSVVLVRKRTIPTKRPQPADEVSANFSC
jgi:hypothetical protein